MKKLLLIVLLPLLIEAESSFLRDVTNMAHDRKKISEHSTQCQTFFYKLTACMIIMSDKQLNTLKPSSSDSKVEYQKNLGNELIHGCKLLNIFESCKESIIAIEDRNNAYAHIHNNAEKQSPVIQETAINIIKTAEHNYLYKRIYRLFKGLNAHLFDGFNF